MRCEEARRRSLSVACRERLWMSDGSDSVLAFGNFRLFPAQRRLEKDGKPVRLGGRALDVLTVLAERAGEVVLNRSLLESVWQDVTVEESSLRFHIKEPAEDPRRQPGRYSLREQCARTRLLLRCTDDPNRAPRNRLVTSQPPARYALPRFGTRVIGRESVIDALVPRLAERGPLTIVGPGGIGKSTVALALAHARQADYQHGVCFVDLAPLSRSRPCPSRSCCSARASVALRRPFRRSDRLSSGQAGFACPRQLRARRRLCRNSLRGSCWTARRTVRILATSREPLRTHGEHVHRLAPLELPPETAQITSREALSFSAIQLFVARAGRALAGFGLTDANTEAVVDICRKLDGMPLAIELATSRIDVPWTSRVC